MIGQAITQLADALRYAWGEVGAILILCAVAYACFVLGALTCVKCKSPKIVAAVPVEPAQAAVLRLFCCGELLHPAQGLGAIDGHDEHFFKCGRCRRAVCVRVDRVPADQVEAQAVRV